MSYFLTKAKFFFHLKQNKKKEEYNLNLEKTIINNEMIKPINEFIYANKKCTECNIIFKRHGLSNHMFNF